MIDLHCHLLPGIDDGPNSLEGSVALARVAEGAGIATIVATPHVSWRYPNVAEEIAQLLEQTRARLSAEGLRLEIRQGAEIAMTRLEEIPDAELPRLALGGGMWLLIEPPFSPAVAPLEAILLGLQSQGHRILLAHPERCPAFHRDPEMLRALVSRGILTSITAGSLVGQFGSQARRFGLELLREGLAHNVASDAHDDTNRPPGLAAEIEQAGLASLTEWLTCTVPAAILDGSEAVPPRPALARPRSPRARWLARSRRR